MSDEGGVVWLAVQYDAAGRVVSEQWGGPADTIAITAGREATVVDRRGKTRGYTHGDRGEIREIVEPGAARTGFAYSSDGQLESVTHPEGDRVVYSYAGRGSSDPLHWSDVTRQERHPRPGTSSAIETVVRAYDHLSRIVSETDARNRQTRYDYTNLDVITITAPRGAVTRVELNRYGQAVQETGPEGLVTEWSYHAETSPGGTTPTVPAVGLDPSTGGYLAAETVDPAGLGLRTRYTYDASGLPASVTNAALGSTTFRYDPRGLLVAATRSGVGREDRVFDDRGYLERTSFEHTGAGGTVVVTEDHSDPLGVLLGRTVTGPGLEAPLITRYEYDRNRNLQAVLHPLGWTERFEYDDRNRLTTTTRQLGDQVASTVTREYAEGNVRTIAGPRPGVGPIAFEYDGHGRLAKVTSPDGEVTERVWEPGPLLQSETVRNAEDEVVRSSTFRYDDLGFLTAETAGPDPEATVVHHPDRAGRDERVTDGREKTWRFEYHANGWLRAETDPLQNRTDFAYHPLGGVRTTTTDGVTWRRDFDAFGRLRRERDPRGHGTDYTYDSRDNVLTRTDARGATTSVRYDALDRRLRTDGPSGEVVRQTWDAEGNLLTYVDALDHTTSYGYDALGRRTSVTYPGLGGYLFGFDEADLVTSITSPAGLLQTLTYDGSGRLKTRRVADASQAVIEEEEYRYDALGALTYAQNRAATIERELNSFGRVKKETLSIAGGLSRTTRHGYDAGLALTSTTLPSGRSITVQVDDAGRPRTLTPAAGPVVAYAYEGPSRLLRKSVGPLESSYGYDAERKLATVDRDWLGKRLVAQTVRWTPRGELERETDRMRRNLKSAFAYDQAGRLREAQFAVPAAGGGPPLLRTSLAVDSVRNVTGLATEVAGPYVEAEAREVTEGNRYASVDGQPLTYSAEGAVEIDAEGRSLTYDWAGRLTHVAMGTREVDYAYDALGRKVKRTDTAAPMRFFFYDDWQLVLEAGVGGSPSTEVLNGRSVDEPVAYWDSAGRERKVLQDRQGSVIGIVDGATGKVLERYEYLDPYGRFRRREAERLDSVRLEGEDLVLRFTGEMDLETAGLGGVEIRPSVSGAWRISDDGREIHFRPDDPPPPPNPEEPPPPRWPAVPIRVEVTSDLRSVFALDLAEERAFEWDGADLTDRPLADWEPLRITQVVQEASGAVRLLFSERIDPDSPRLEEAVRIRRTGGMPLRASIVIGADGLSLEVTPVTPITVDEPYEVALLAGGVQDLGQHEVEAGEWTWTAGETGISIWGGEWTPASAASLFENRFFFQGRELDTATGLYDFRNRWYDPALGRFLSRDPLGYPDGPNQYAGFVGDPVNNTDPYGTESVSTWLDPADDFAAGGLWSLWGGGKWFVRSEWNGLTFNFLDRHDPARDAYDDGLISGSDYLNETGKATAQSSVEMAATALLPGVGGELAVASGATRIGSYTTGRILGYGVQGAAIGGGTRLASDISAQALYGESFSSPGDYAVSIGGGATIGAILGAAVTRHPVFTRRIGGPAPNAVTRPKFNAATTQRALADAPLGADGGATCPDCGTGIGRGTVQVGSRQIRDFMLDHFKQTWAQTRGSVPRGISRPDVIRAYNTGVRATCRGCNLGHRFEPPWCFPSLGFPSVVGREARRWR